MAQEDLIAILIYGGGAALCGAITAIIFCRRQHPFIGTAAWSFLGAPLLALLIVAIFGAVESTRRFGFNPGWAIGAALSSVFFLMFSVPILCGVPALTAGLVTQCLLQLLLRLSRRKTKA